MSKSKELIHYWDGSMTLVDHAGELLWSSDDDESFLEEFDACIEVDDTEAVLEYLEDEGYIEPGERVDVVAANEDDVEPEDDGWLH